MASNLRRSRRTIGQRFLRTENRLEALQRRPIPSRIGQRVIISSNLAPGAVRLPALDTDVTQYIQSTADGKNAIYRQTDPPAGGTYAVGDLWFDTDDGNKIYRNTVAGASPNWQGFTLGDSALESIGASKITAGTIDASQITVSNIDAGNIVTGTLSSINISGVTISIGTSNTVFKADTNGIYAGNSTFASAPFSVDLDGALKAASGTIAGLTISSSALYYGAGNHANSDTDFYVDNSGNFSVGDKLTWDGSTLSIASGVTIGSNSSEDLITGGDVNTNVTSISGGVITTGTINLNNVNVQTGSSGARLQITSTGLAAYDSGGTQTVSIGSDGSASFTGSITATSADIGGWGIGTITDGSSTSTTAITSSSNNSYLSSTGWAWFTTGVITASIRGYLSGVTTGGGASLGDMVIRNISIGTGSAPGGASAGDVYLRY